MTPRLDGDRAELYEKLRASGMSAAQARVIAGEFGTPPPQAPKEPAIEAGVRKLMQALVLEAAKLGDDVEIRPGSSGITCRRVRQFAVARLVGGGRVELGLALPTARTTDRLRLASSSFGSARRITHSVTLTSAADVDRQVQDWLRTAYDQDGERRRPSERRKPSRGPSRRRAG